jgi:glyoxylase-like metal-dependent hydrolase (beta-lactamase superfamily II)
MDQLPPISLLAAAGGSSLLFRQLFDAGSGTFTYLLADGPSRQGLIIDPVFEQHNRDLALIQELGIALLASLDTHVHADHVTGSWLLHEASGCGIGLAAVAGAANVTQPLADGDQISFGSRWLQVRATPGHTNGCLSFVLDDQSLAFSGDALLVRGCGRCDFQQGNAHTLWRSINEQIFTLPDHCLLYPGHDYTGRNVTSVVEEKAYNARLGGNASERDFVGPMANLKLPHPNKIAEALPGNLRCGKLHTSATEPSWTPLSRSYAGLPELNPAWVAAHQASVTLLDLRSAGEFDGPDGHVAGSLLIPPRSWRAAAARSLTIGRWWWSASPAAARPWPPSNCSRPAGPRWPTCAAAWAAGPRRATRSSVRHRSEALAP